MPIPSSYTPIRKQVSHINTTLISIFFDANLKLLLNRFTKIYFNLFLSEIITCGA